MSFTVPQGPVRGSQSSGMENGTNGSDDNLPKDNQASSAEAVFAMPSAPVKKSTMLPPPPPPPPLFPKEDDDDDEPANTDAPSIPSQSMAPPPRDSKPAGNAPPLKYHKPAWSGYPNQQFFFEVIKNGVIVDRIKAPEKEFLVIGRLPLCDLEMEHPSLSRYHAIIQFKSNGECFIYDLNSSHGTKLNKSKIPPQMHVSLKPGDQLRFGESTRIYLFQTEQEVDREEEDRKMVASMIERQNRTKENSQKQTQGEDDGCNWGMQEDAEDEDDEDAPMDGSVRRPVDPDAYYRKDPKKALRHYLESKGFSCEFEIEEEGPGHAREYTARIRLPIETSMGPVYGQATTGKKRDAEREAALDACIQLDSRGMLGNNSSGEASAKPRGKKVEFSDDDDDDDFYDRTTKKKAAAKKTEQKADTHESLLEKHKDLLVQMSKLETKIQEYDASAAERKRLEESGDLDAYMASLEKSGGDSKAKMQQTLASMKKEEKQLLQLIEYTKPIDFMAKIKAGTSGSSADMRSSSSESLDKNTENRHVKRLKESDVAAEKASTVKKPRVLGPAMPPPS
ncbi:Kanadaptin [Mortierella alpina]|uniref:Kanadaptin n=1 Tax=Mortierella alpina TaxID=64518 RepID=A0A9P6M6S5_MORAP|nr:Kanadaptin [Mortierella alpina]